MVIVNKKGCVDMMTVWYIFLGFVVLYIIAQFGTCLTSKGSTFESIFFKVALFAIFGIMGCSFIIAIIAFFTKT